MDSRDWKTTTPLWERLAGLAGLVLFGVSVTFLLFQSLTGSGQAPDIEFEIDRINATAEAYLVLVTVRNTGERTAADLQMRARLTTNETTQSREVTVDYLASGSTGQVAFFFGTDPAAGELAFDAISYRVP